MIAGIRRVSDSGRTIAMQILPRDWLYLTSCRNRHLVCVMNKRNNSLGSNISIAGEDERPASIYESSKRHVIFVAVLGCVERVC